jgi:hypothetical protein
VSGAADEVVAKLVEATGASAAWCRFDEVLEEGRTRSVFVNAGVARLVTGELEPTR